MYVLADLDPERVRLFVPLLLPETLLVKLRQVAALSSAITLEE